MAFTDINFISRFLPIFLIIYFIVEKKYQTWVLLLASMIFYCMGDFRFLPVLLILSGVNYIFSIVNWGSRVKNRNSRKKTLAYIIAIDASTLVLFKVIHILGGIYLPLGISFFIFKMVSYQIDIYRGDIEKPASFIDMLTYFSLFFQIAQGPIMRYHEEDFEEEKHKFSLVNLEEGLKYLIIGLGMKILLADRLAILWNEAVKNGFDSLSTPMAWLSVIAYAMELYFDFWGYSLMAAGIGVMIGFPFIENFNHPYSAKSISGFYRRWHMTLTSWFKDYVYIPLGGSRNGTELTIYNIILVWLLTGFWHGDGIHYILWGILLAIIIIVEKFLLNKYIENNNIIGHLYIILLLPITWVFFAVSKLSDIGILLLKMIPITGNIYGINQGDFLNYLEDFWPYLLVSILLCVPKVYETITRKYDNYIKFIQTVCLVIILWTSLYFSFTSQSNPFLYFNF